MTGLLVLGLFFGVSGIRNEVHAAASFSDTRGHWAEYKIETAVSRDIVKGYQNGTFGPDKKVSRAEFICMLNRALGNLYEAEISFSDVKSGDWYYNDVAKAVNAAYATGFEDGTFKPDKIITRQEAAFMITMVVPTYGESSNLKIYSDYGKISDWAYKAMSKVVGKGYMSGYSDGKLHPKDALTRAQAVALITDIMDHETIVTSEPVIDDDDTKLSGKIYPNHLKISKDLEEGSVIISDCVVLGTLSVKGGGKNTVNITNSRVANLDVSKANSSVRVQAKGGTSIERTTGSKDFILQTSSLDGAPYGAGFEKIDLSGTASVILRGNFPELVFSGTGATAELESGSIEKLTVSDTAKTPQITIARKASVDVAYVDAAANFYGEGSIGKMYANAKGISYEVKPKSVIVGSAGSIPASGDEDGAVTIQPEKGDTDVYINAGITITFDSKMTNAKGKAISASKVDDIISLTEGSASGTKVDFSATISKNGDVFTLVPSAALKEETKYYITIAADTMKNASGEMNAAFSSYFTTGEDTEALAVTFYPADKATSIPLTERNFTIRFSEKITDANGGTLEVGDNSYLKKEAITVVAGGKALAAADYDVELATSRKVITVKLDKDLVLNTNYTVGIVAGKLKTENGTKVAASTAAWTSAGTPAISTPTAEAFETSIRFTAKSSVQGTLYAVILPGTASAPLAPAIRSGQDASGKAALGSGAVSLNAGASGTLSFSGLTTCTDYKIYAAVYDAKGNVSTVTTLGAKTLPLQLSSLTIRPVGGGSNVLSNFAPGTFKYTGLYLPCGTDSVVVTAAANTDIFVGTLSINGDSTSKSVTVPVPANGKLIVAVVLQETGKTAVIYTIELQRIGSVDLSTMTLDGDAYTPGTVYTLDSAITESVVLNISPVDLLGAKVYVDGTKIANGENTTLNISPTTTSVTFLIRSVEEQDSKSYTITFARPLAP